MKSEPCVVFDANVIVSALLFEQSTPRKAFDKARYEFQIVVSPLVLDELRSVLMRPKFDRYISRDLRELFFSTFLKIARVVEPSERLALCRDPRDDKYLELALAAEATALVTGDKDLLALNPFRRTAILTPEQFLQAFSAL